jgi:predicted GNAT superfamily acetyltransferase
MPDDHGSIVIRDLVSLADYDACVELQDETWGRGFSERVPGAILQVAQHIGGVAAGAFDQSGLLIGFVFGMTGVKTGAVVHWSDMLAVRAEARGLRIGERLKLYQRDKVAALGVSKMFWTADPLVARNAHFNINLLGAAPVEYHQNLYGANTGSVLHGAMPTDRFVYHWMVGTANALPNLSGTPAPGDQSLQSVVKIDHTGRPHHVAQNSGAENVIVAIPNDLSEIQSRDASLALAWRFTVREAIEKLFAKQYVVSRFVRAQEQSLPYYVLTASA